MKIGGRFDPTPFLGIGVQDMLVGTAETEILLPPPMAHLLPQVLELQRALDTADGGRSSAGDFYYLTAKSAKVGIWQRRPGAHRDGAPEQYGDDENVSMVVAATILGTVFYDQLFDTSGCQSPREECVAFDQQKREDLRMEIGPCMLAYATSQDVHESPSIPQDMMRVFVRLIRSPHRHNREGNTVNTRMLNENADYAAWTLYGRGAVRASLYTLRGWDGDYQPINGVPIQQAMRRM